MAYRGITARLPIGQLGFTGTQNPSQALPGHFVFVDGAELDGGVIRKEGGANKLNPFAIGATFGNDEFTKVLLHFDGVDASTTFTDSNAGGSAHTWTAAGNAQIDTAESVFGGASGLFDGTGDSVSTPDHADFVLDSGNFTIDCWFNNSAAADSNFRRIAEKGTNSPAANIEWFIARNDSANGSTIFAGVSDGVTITFVSGTTPFTDTINSGWHHVALVRTGDLLKLFIDGIEEGSNAFTGSVNNTAGDIFIGIDSTNSHPWQGWIEEFRMSVDVARETSNFTPPPMAYATPTAADTIVSGISWSPIAAAHRDAIFTDAGRVLKDSGAGTFLTVLASGLNNQRSPPPWFMVGGGEAVGSPRTLFMFSGSNQVQAVDGDGNTMSAITGPPADWSAAFPTFGILHGGRIFAGGNGSDPHRLYYSTLTDHQDFVGAGAGTFAIYPGEGERIAGAVSFRGALVIFKYPVGIYVLNTSDPDPANWVLIALTSAVGTLNQHTIVQVERDVLYMDRIGNIHSLGATDDFGDVTTSDIGHANDISPFMRRSVNLAALDRCQGIWYPAKSQAWFAMPRSGTTDNDFRLIVTSDIGDQGSPIPRFFMSRRDICTAMWMRLDGSDVPRPVFGDNEGFIWLADQDSHLKDGAGYEVRFETSDMDLSFVDPSLATRWKNGQFIELAFEPAGDWNLTVEAYWDDVLTDIIQFPMITGGAPLGTFELGVDALGSNRVSSIRKRLAGSGRRLVLIGYNAGAGQSINIASFHLDFTVGDERDGQ